MVGAGGLSSRQFERLSRLPWLVLPPQFALCRLQPVRVEDLCAALLAALQLPAAAAPWALVGPEQASVAEWIARRRAQRGAAPAKVRWLPQALVRASAALGDSLRASSWSREALGLLAADSVADAAETARFAALLGRPPRHPLDGDWR